MLGLADGTLEFTVGTPRSALHTQERTCELHAIDTGDRDIDGGRGEELRETNGQQSNSTFGQLQLKGIKGKPILA